MLSVDINNISSLKQSTPGRQQISTSQFFIEKVEWPGITRQPSSMHIRSTVLAPARASPSAAVTGSAACSFTRINPSAAVLVAYPPLSTFLRLTFLYLSPTLLRHTFAPSVAAAMTTNRLETVTEIGYSRNLVESRQSVTATCGVVTSVN